MPAGKLVRGVPIAVNVSSPVEPVKDALSYPPVVVGGSQGVFYEVNPGEAANPNPNWTQLGQLLPRAMVSDLRYDARDDVLVAGTLGRGAWKITRAKFQTSQTVVLSILGDDPSFPSLDPGKPQDDLIRLRRDPADPRTLQVFLNNTNLNAPDFTAPLVGVRRIEVNGLAGDDRLIVDSSFGLIDVPERIQFQGGLRWPVAMCWNCWEGPDRNRSPRAGPPEAAAT
jgi:hypothetical protein